MPRVHDAAKFELWRERFPQFDFNGISLTPYDPEFQQQMEIAKMAMREDRDALRALSK